MKLTKWLVGLLMAVCLMFAAGCSDDKDKGGKNVDDVWKANGFVRSDAKCGKCGAGTWRCVEIDLCGVVDMLICEKDDCDWDSWD